MKEDSDMATPHIEDYHFGEIVIDGKTYTDDVIILPDRVVGSWWRDKGHRLQSQDLEVVMEAKPDVLIVGQGAYGRMKIAPESQDVLRKAGIQLRASDTKEACETYNRICADQKTAAALHLTC
jgi:hypothetical protein